MNKFIIFILCILPIVLAQSTSPIPTSLLQTSYVHSNQVECSLCKLSVDIIDLAKTALMSLIMSWISVRKAFFSLQILFLKGQNQQI